MPKLLDIGKIVNTHGLKGEIKVTPWCDDVSVFEEVPLVYIEGVEYKVSYARVHKHSYLIKLDGVDKIEQAELLKNKIISANKIDMPVLSENEYYIDDLIGMSVYEDDNKIGEITSCFATGSNDVYVVKLKSGKEVLIPAIKQVVKSIDVKDKCMNVELMEGLMPDED